MRRPNVSIIIPCYNAERTIKSTIDSIKWQIYKNFEVIFVNDGSTDNTLNAIEHYMGSSNIRYTIITQPNSGVSVARNTGIEASIGDYIMFLDADDIYHPYMVMYLVEQMERTKVDTAFCSFTRNIHDLPNMKFKDIEDVVLLDNYKLQKNLFFQNVPCALWTFVYKKNILDEFKIRFVPNIKYGEDEEFTWKYLCHCSSGAVLNMQL